MGNNDDDENPRIILLFCGKRKSGKDFLTEWLLKNLTSKSVILRLSGPLKQCYAENHGLDYARLLDASDYKEQYRKDMISWSEKIRNTNPAYFCLKSIAMYEADKYPIWIISDCRRKSDFEFFTSNFSGRSEVTKIRVTASEHTRNSRGFKFQDGVDNAESECGLDTESCNYVIENNGQLPADQLLQNVLKKIEQQMNL
jgi:phosphomevalonate kinase